MIILHHFQYIKKQYAEYTGINNSYNPFKCCKLANYLILERELSFQQVYILCISSSFFCWILHRGSFSVSTLTVFLSVFLSIDCAQRFSVFNHEAGVTYALGTDRTTFKRTQNGSVLKISSFLHTFFPSNDSFIFAIL